jgi:hypothetical protein
MKTYNQYIKWNNNNPTSIKEAERKKRMYENKGYTLKHTFVNSITGECTLTYEAMQEPTRREGLMIIEKHIKDKLGNKPTYQEFFDSFIEKFREIHPNSAAPNNDILGYFYDDYLKHNLIIGY